MATNPTDGTPSPLVRRVRNILLQPKTEWPVIDAEPATIGGIYRNYVVILAAIPPICMAIGMLLIGFSFLFVTVRLPVETVIANAILHYIESLVGVFILALIIEALAPSFGGVKDRVKAFKLAAYSYTAAWVAGILLLLPSLAILAALLGLYGFYLLYLGLPVLMKSPPDKSIAYIAVTIVAAIVIFLILGEIGNVIERPMLPAAPVAASYTVTG